MTEIITMKFGSHVYGTNVPTSDLDYKTIFLPEPEEIILQRVKDSKQKNTNNSEDKNTSEDIDHEFFSFQKYCHLLSQGQTVALDMLFTPEEFYTKSPDKVWENLKKNKHIFLHSGVASFVGYCKQQANKYGIKGSRIATLRSARHVLEYWTKGHNNIKEMKLKDYWPAIENFAKHNQHTRTYSEEAAGHTYKLWEVCGKKLQDHNSFYQAMNMFDAQIDEYGKRALQAESNEGIDWKALMHATRVLYEAKELLSSHKITFPRPEKELLLDIRQGKMGYKEVAKIIEDGMEELNDIKDNSVLPKSPDYKKIDELVYNAYSDVILDSLS